MEPTNVLLNFVVIAFAGLFWLLPQINSYWENVILRCSRRYRKLDTNSVDTRDDLNDINTLIRDYKDGWLYQVALYILPIVCLTSVTLLGGLVITYSYAQTISSEIFEGIIYISYLLTAAGTILPLVSTVGIVLTYQPTKTIMAMEDKIQDENDDINNIINYQS